MDNRAALEDVDKGIEFCMKYAILSDEHLESCGEMELSDKSVVDYLGFVREFLFAVIYIIMEHSSRLDVSVVFNIGLSENLVYHYTKWNPWQIT
jgi:hypothetical protein